MAPHGAEGGPYWATVQQRRVSHIKYRYKKRECSASYCVCTAVAQIKGMWSVIARCPTERLYSLSRVAAWEMRIAAAIQAGRAVANWAVKKIFST
jgi:hypothetical protein